MDKLVCLVILQPENPSELSGKIYEMMGSALVGKWTAIPSHPASPLATEPIEAEVVQPLEAGGQK